MRPTLRPYQQRAIDSVREFIRRGVRRVCLIAPTGSGKTVKASAIIHGAVDRGSRALFLAHRKELIDQTVDKLALWGVDCGVIMADDPRTDPYHQVQVASVQTLSRRLDELPPAQLVIVDECHHAVSPTYAKILERYPQAVILGLTATPWRVDKRGLGDVYQASVLAATPAELIESGALVRYDAFAYDAPDLHDVGTVAGEFNQRDLGLACNTGVLVGAVVREYMKHAEGGRAILFPVNVEHSLALVREFRDAGVAAMHVDCDTPKTERETILRGFASGAYTVVSSVGVLTEGFDCPAAEVCIMARPTKSLSLHLQMIGRVLRPFPGKQRALIHDHAGNLIRHGMPDDPRDYRLTATSQRVIERYTCPYCCVVFGRTRPDGTCPSCGQVIGEAVDKQREQRAREQKQTVDGVRLSADQIRAMRERGIRPDLSDRQVARAAKASREEKAAEYLRLKDVRARKGFEEGFVSHQFRAAFGHWPRFKPEELAGVQPASTPFFQLPPRAAREAA